MIPVTFLRPASAPPRWHFEKCDRGLMVCKGTHEKWEDCTFEAYEEEPPARPKPYLVHWLNHQYPPIRWPWMRWVVAMQGKKSVWFEHHTVALAFGIYAARCPQVMQDTPRPIVLDPDACWAGRPGIDYKVDAPVNMKTAYANLNEDGTITVHGIQR